MTIKTYVTWGMIGAVLWAGTAMAQVKIGVAAPLTGPNAAFGEQLKNGADQAVVDINSTGGVLGKPVAEIVVDDACDPKQAVSAANQLVTDGVVAVDGHFCSASSIPASKVYAENGIVEISPSSTTPAYTDQGSAFTFRTCGRDDEQAIIAVQYITKHFSKARIAILDDNSTYGKGIADLVRNALSQNGISVVLNESYTAGEKDFSPLISRIKAARVDFVYVGGYYADDALLMRQGKAQRLMATWMSEAATATAATWQIAGDAAEGALLTFTPPPDKNPAAAKVVTELKAKGIDPGSYLLYSYAAVQIWAEAANKAQSTRPEKVARELKTGGPWPSVLGPISFDAKGDPVKINYQVFKWHNGNYFTELGE